MKNIIYRGNSTMVLVDRNNVVVKSILNQDSVQTLASGKKLVDGLVFPVTYKYYSCNGAYVMCEDNDQRTEVTKIDPKKYIFNNEENLFVPFAFYETYTMDTDYVSMTINEFINDRVAAVSKICNRTIENGVDVQLSDGSIKHFSLSQYDQINLSNNRTAINIGVDTFIYHADGEESIIYNGEDMGIIINTAFSFKDYNLLLCNLTNTWIRRCTTKEEINGISFGSTLPTDLNEKLLASFPQ